MKNLLFYTLIAPFLLVFNNDLLAIHYYIDAENGNDNNAGISVLEPWKSLEKVNNTNFLPGDSVFFKKNNIWTGALQIHSAGTAGNPIVFTAYGVGNKPLINGNGAVQAAIFIRNSASYIVVDGFSVTNFDGQDIFDGAEGLRCGIQIGEWSGALKQVQVQNNEVYFVEGCSNHPVVGAPRGSSLDSSQYNLYQNAGIFCHATYMDSLTIQGNYVHDCTCSGIFPFQFEPATNLLIRQNSVYNVGADGIVIINATSPLVELNACIKAGNNSGTAPRMPGQLGANGLAVAGIWSTGCSDPVFQYNYCEATTRITWDGQAWDFDLNTTGNAVYQYNYSRDNEGGFNLGGAPNQVFRYNISYNDGAKQGNAQSFFNGSPTYSNNVFYRTDGQPFLLEEDVPQAFRNNIFFTAATSGTTYQNAAHTFSNNCFYGHIPDNPGSNPVLADPGFLSPAAPGKILPGTFFTIEDLRNAVSGFQLNPGSACIDAGQENSSSGAVDFWGNAVPDLMPDIGIHEFTSIPSSVTPFPEQSGATITAIPVRFYPNPSTTFIIADGLETGDKIQWTDISGKVIKDVSFRGDKLDTADLHPGFYWVKVIRKGSVWGVFKMVKG